jgi:hypothetical protein
MFVFTRPSRNGRRGEPAGQPGALAGYHVPHMRAGRKEVRLLTSPVWEGETKEQWVVRVYLFSGERFVRTPRRVIANCWITRNVSYPDKPENNVCC